jgi:hypothetical protein
MPDDVFELLKRENARLESLMSDFSAQVSEAIERRLAAPPESKPLPAADTMTRGYAQEAAKREAARNGDALEDGDES